MSAAKALFLGLFISVFLSGCLVTRAQEIGDEEDNEAGFSIISPPDTKKCLAYPAAYTAELPLTPGSGDERGMCMDLDLVDFYHKKHTATTPHNTTLAYITMATGEYFALTSFALCPLSVSESRTPKPKPMCTPVIRGQNETLEVKLVNSSSLLALLGNKNESTNGYCTLLLFFAPWCMFCADMAPHYNALPRAFPQINILAIDAVHFSTLNTRYGTTAVPNILLFYNNTKAVAKFNHTERTLQQFVQFISNITGFKPDETVTVSASDFEGPLLSVPSKDKDWLLGLAWVFVIVCSIAMIAKSECGKKCWNAVFNFGLEQRHLD